MSDLNIDQIGAFFDGVDVSDYRYRKELELELTLKVSPRLASHLLSMETRKRFDKWSNENRKAIEEVIIKGLQLKREIDDKGL